MMGQLARVGTGNRDLLYDSAVEVIVNEFGGDRGPGMAGGVEGATPYATTLFTASPIVGDSGSAYAAFSPAAEASMPFKKPRMAFTVSAKRSSAVVPPDCRQ
jgi:hypothetical protein